MIAAIAMSALSIGALLELALAAFIRGRAGRRRDASVATSVVTPVVAPVVAPAVAPVAAAASVEPTPNQP